VLDARRLQTAIAGGVAATLLGSPLVGFSAAVSIELSYIIDTTDRLND
jgi:hypothetical protein